MTAPGDDDGATSMPDVAEETPQESLAKEAEAVGDGPDVGGTVPADDSQ